MGMEYGVTELIVNASPLENPSVGLRDPAAWASHFGGESTSGIDINFRSVMGYPPIFRAVSLIAAKCAGTPVQVIDRESKVVQTGHSAARLVGKNQQASPLCNSLQWWKTMTLHAQIYGGGWSMIYRNHRGEPSQLHLLDPLATVKMIVNGELWWATEIGGEMVPVSDRDVVHISSITPDGIEGCSMLDLMRNALGLPLAAQQYSSRFFSNGSNLSGILMVPGHFDEMKIKNTISAWDSMQTGLTKAHKIALLQDGVKWQPTAADPEKSQLNETRDHELRATVSNITGVPPHLLGDSTRTSHNSLESENVSLLQNCLRPWFDVWEAELNSKLRSDADKRANKLTIEFNVRDLIRMEQEKRVASYAKLKEIGVMTTNQILAAENMPTIGDEGDIRYVPANWIRSDQPQPEPNPQPTSTQPAATMTESTPAASSAPASPGVLRSMIESSVTKSIQLESDRVVQAAKAESGFMRWVEGFYDQWPQKSVVAGTDVLEPFIHHAAISKAQLLDAAGSATDTTLAGCVADCVATWNDRTETLTNQVLEDTIDADN